MSLVFPETSTLHKMLAQAILLIAWLPAYPSFFVSPRKQKMRLQELQPEASLTPPLDEKLLKLTDSDVAFMRCAVSQDDLEVKRRILDVQSK